MARKIDIKLPKIKISPQLVHLLGGRTLSILALMVACFIVLSGFWHQQHNLVATGEAQVATLQGRLVDSTFGNMTKVVKTLTNKVAFAAREPEMVAVFESGHSMVVDLQQTLLKKTIPEALAICLLTTAVNEPDPAGCVPINFVVLDLLRQAKERAKHTPFAITELADKQKALVITHQVANTAGEVIGILLIAFDPTEVLSLLPNLSHRDGFITLQQGKATKMPLAISGDLKWRNGEPQINYHLLGSYWDLSYWPAETNSEAAFLGLVTSVLLGLTLLWFWREFWQNLLLRQDMATVTKQVKDWKRDDLQLNYPVGNRSVRSVVSLIAGLGPIASEQNQATAASLQDIEPQEVTRRYTEEVMDTGSKEEYPSELASKPISEVAQDDVDDMLELNLATKQKRQEHIPPVIETAENVPDTTEDTIDFNLTPPKK